MNGEFWGLEFNQVTVTIVTIRIDMHLDIEHDYSISYQIMQDSLVTEATTSLLPTNLKNIRRES